MKTRKPYKYNSFERLRLENLINTIVLEGEGAREPYKYNCFFYKYNGSGRRKQEKHITTMALKGESPKTLYIQLFWKVKERKPYKYNGFGR